MTELKPNDVHLWSLKLAMTDAEEALYLSYLSSDELQKADRFYFPLHRHRYIVARAMLRKLIAGYLHTEPQLLDFLYTPHGKPFLPVSSLQFNLSHSNELAVYAFTLNAAIGVDIEKMKTSFEESVAKRFFSEDEYLALMAKPMDLRVKAFYGIWARKEAAIKAIGRGLGYPLDSFTVPVDEAHEPCLLRLDDSDWELHSICVDKDYQSAFVTQQSVKAVLWQTGAT
jgi:4'-phosphopantetheinyl transferase